MQRDIGRAVHWAFRRHSRPPGSPLMIASIASATLLGVRGRPVLVEVQSPTACRASRWWACRTPPAGGPGPGPAALLSSGLPWPLRRVTVNVEEGQTRCHRFGRCHRRALATTRGGCIVEHEGGAFMTSYRGRGRRSPFLLATTIVLLLLVGGAIGALVTHAISHGTPSERAVTVTRRADLHPTRAPLPQHSASHRSPRRTERQASRRTRRSPSRSPPHCRMSPRGRPSHR